MKILILYKKKKEKCMHLCYYIENDNGTLYKEKKKCKPIITDDNPVRGTKPIVFAELRK